MTKVKRTLSAVLAFVMIFTTMTVAFTVIGNAGAAPIVPRTAALKLSPNVVLYVPGVLKTYGTDFYQRGSNVIPGGQIQVTITSVNGSDVRDVALACSDAGVQLSARVQQGQDGYIWTVQGGTLKTAPADNGSTAVKWTLTCTVGGKTFTTYAWSQVQPLYNNPGFAMYVRHKNGMSSHTTKNHHVQWIEPVLGDAATNTREYYSQCYINESSGQHYASTAGSASAYYWDEDQGSGDDITESTSTTVTGSIYADVSQVSTLSDIGMQSKARTHKQYDNDGDHPQSYLGTDIASQTVNGSTVNIFTANTHSTEVSPGDVVGDSFTGSLPQAGSVAVINARVEWEGQITRGILPQKSYHRIYGLYSINVVTYDKTALWTAISKASAANYQSWQFRNTAPSGSGYGGFVSWDSFLSKLQNAWFIYGREDVTQSQINSAASELTNAMPVYSSSTGNWVSGMMYGPADYSQIDTIVASISQTLDPDFLEAYSDGTYGKYYQYSLASALNNALEDVDYDRPLDARYQGTVDQMRTNISNAITALGETPQRQTTKLVSVEFIGNSTDVMNVPGSVTTCLTGQFTEPSVSPSKQYYRFLGWFYDEAATQAVTWPLNVDITSPYFIANLNTKVDNAGVAYRLYAGWQLNAKMLEFDTQGGSSIAPVIGDEGDPYTGPTETPTKAGYRFIGWYADATLQTPVDWNTFTFGTVDVVYAMWERDYFTVTFNANGGTFPGGAAVISVTDLYGNPVPEPQSPTRNGYGFVGWYYDNTFLQPINFNSFTIPSSNMQVYAKWSDTVRNVTFDPQNGTAPIIQTYSVGASVSEPDEPTRTGYTFKGWYDSPSADGTPISFPFTLSGENVMLYAGWNPLKFSVFFVPGDGASMAPSFNASDYHNLDCGSVLVPPVDPIKEGYLFTGWTLDGQPYTFSTVPAQNLTLTASWIIEPNMAKFRLRTDADSTVSQGDIITATVSLQANHIVSANSFIVYYDSRYLQPALNGVAVTSAITGTTACSTEPGRAYFTLVRNAGGNVTDCGMATGRIMSGITPTSQWFPSSWIKDARTLKDEYSHYGFVYYTISDTSTGTRIQPDPEVDIASFQFIVRDDAPLADGVSSYAQILLSSEFTRTPERTLGKTAACPEESTAYVNKKNWDNTTNVILSGDQRFAVAKMETCRIDFVTNGGVAVDSIAAAKRGRAIALPTTTRSYYDFVGWTLTNDPADTNYVSQDAYVVPNQESVTLYAKWRGQEATYYVRHHKQNADATGFIENYEQEALTATIGTTVNAASKEYPGFTCMNDGESGVVKGDSANPLYIDLWYLRKTTKITFNANGGVFPSSQQTIEVNGLYDSTVTNVPADPSRTGYIFGGWQYNGSDYTVSKFPANNIIVYAKWTAKTVTVRFFLNGSSTVYQSFTGKYGDPITAPEVSVEDGQIFSGWRNGSGVLFTYETFPANDEDFFGSVSIDGKMLTLYINGFQYGEPIPVPTGTSVTEAYIGYQPEPGYKFTGWRSANSVDAPLVSLPMTLESDMTLYGFTTREVYTIRTYVYVDGEIEDGPFVNNLFYGATFDLPEADDYTDFGYGFRGWYIDPDLTTLYVKPDTMPAENIVLYGEYYELAGTLEFDLNGGSGPVPASITRPIGATVNQLPAGDGITRKYYTFDGWSTSPSGTPVVTKYTFTQDGVVKLYAIWKVNYATITFNLNGADSGTRPASMQAEIGDPIPAADLPSGADFVRNGYIFVGWAERSNATTAMEFFTASTVGSKTLFAVWMADRVDVVAKEGSTTVIDTARGLIYGLTLKMTLNTLTESYLDVVGNGHLEFSSNTVGTGTQVSVINDYSGTVDATYTIVIFGDVNGDGMLNTTDLNTIRSVAAKLTVYDADSAQQMAADVNHDGTVNTSDYTLARSANASLSSIRQYV